MNDIIVFGATGYTGRLVARYLAKLNDPKLKFAIAGRSLAKLEAIKQEDNLPSHVSILQADSGNADELEKLVRAGRAVISTVGPYQKYGSLLYSICAKLGVIYLDLTGEPVWVAEMIQKHEAAIRKSGAIMLSSSGFDSIPSDFAVLLATRALQDQQGQPAQVGSVVGSVKLKGGASGGTFQTMIEMASMPKQVLGPVLRNQYILSPIKGQSKRRMKLIEDLDQGHGALFPLSFHNERIVMRSWGLRQTLAGQEGLEAWGDVFEYRESLQMTSLFRAYSISIFVAIFNYLLSISWTRSLLKRYGPQPGSGPSEKSLTTGFFRLTANAKSADGKLQASGSVQGNGDPGYGLTSVMIAEAALAALDQNEQLSKLARKVGSLTPSMLGDGYIKRLEATGLFTFASSSQRSVLPENPRASLKAKL